MSVKSSYAGLVAGQVPVLQLSRMKLRPLRVDDAPKIQGLLDDFEIARWMGRIPHPYTVADADYFIEKIALTEISWAIEIAGQGFVGIGGFAFKPENSGIELGYWLGQEHWRLGYATEAARLMLNHAWSAGAQRILSGCFDGKRRSQHVLEKCGFQVVGNSMRFNLARDINLPHIDMTIERPTQISGGMV